MDFRLSGIRKSFGSLEVLGGIDVEMDRDELIVILGPSGCGKTTFLKIVAGLDRAFEGGREGFDDSSFSFVFQDHRLLPWKSAVDNALFALSGTDIERSTAMTRIDRLIRLSGLDGHERRPVRELSGGMRQRASLVRAFCRHADVLLLDEAFQSVDLGRKRELMRLFLGIREIEGGAAILVTHDPWEALWLADRIVVLSDRPAKVVDTFDVDIPRDEREAGMDRVARLERRLSSALMGVRLGPDA